MEISNSKLFSRREVFHETFFQTHTHTGIFRHLKVHRQISFHLFPNLFASKVNLKQTEKCKRKFKLKQIYKKDQKISEYEVDLNWIWKKFEVNLKSMWCEFKIKFFHKVTLKHTVCNNKMSSICTDSWKT